MNTMPSMGRKKKKKAEKRSASLKIMMTDAEREEIDRAAAAVGADTSTWVRGEILKLIRQPPKK